MSVLVECPCGNQPCGISRSDRKWVDHLPHEGWVYHGCFVDTGGLNGNCDMCDKEIRLVENGLFLLTNRYVFERYIHEITHETTGFKIGVGCVCASKLCRHSMDPSMRVGFVRQSHDEAERKAKIPTKESLRSTLDQLTWKNCQFRSKKGKGYVGQGSSFKVNDLKVLVSVYRALNNKGSWYWSTCFFHGNQPPQRKSSTGYFRNPNLAWNQLKKCLYKLFDL